MKTFQQFTLMAVLATAMTLPTTIVLAEPPTSEPAPDAAAAKTNRHLKLCAQLGLKVDRTYEFMISGNDEVHYWTIRSLGSKGWILVRDSRYPTTWVNLSQIIAVTPFDIYPTAERPKKPNRER